MIVPGPARGHIDLECDLAAQALAGCNAGGDGWFGHCPSSSSLRGATATQQSRLSPRLPSGLLRFARNDEGNYSVSCLCPQCLQANFTRVAPFSAESRVVPPHLPQTASIRV